MRYLMKIFMHWDMEGVSGIHRREQVWFWEEGVPQEVASEGQGLLIADINSAAAAALEAGVDELIEVTQVLLAENRESGDGLRTQFVTQRWQVATIQALPFLHILRIELAHRVDDHGNTSYSDP